MGKSAPAAPAAPDPTVTAAAQGAANVNTAVAQQQLNQVNQSTPYGNVSYAQTGSTTTPDGTVIPQYTQSTSLTPTAQDTLTQQQQLAKTLATYGNTIPSELPTGALNFNSAPALQSSVDTSGVSKLSSPTDFGNEATQAQQAAYNQAYGLVQPGQAYAKQQLDAQLDNAGIPHDSEAYKTAENLLSTQQTAQNNNLAQGAVATGNAQQQALSAEALANNQAGFNEATTQAQLGNAARGQSTNEAQVLRNQPFNELAALIQGSPALGAPTSTTPGQSSISPTDVMGAYGLNQSAKNTAYQGQVANTNANNQAAASTATTAAMIAAMALSDRRVKVVSDIPAHGLEIVASIPVHTARYIGEVASRDRAMVMAQDIEQIVPSAVTEIGGVKMVDTAQLVPALIAAIQELSAKVAALEARA